MAFGFFIQTCWQFDRRCVWQCLLPEMDRKQLIVRSEIHFTKREEGVSGKQNKKDMSALRNLLKHLSSLKKIAPYVQGAGQTNKLLKINLTNYCLSRFWVSHAWLGTQSKGADAERSWRGRRLTTSCLGNYHHFWHELRGLLAASLLLLNSLLCWLMMKREHAPTPLLGLWHNVCASPVTLPAGQAKHNTHTEKIVWTTTGG